MHQQICHFDGTTIKVYDNMNLLQKYSRILFGIDQN